MAHKPVRAKHTVVYGDNLSATPGTVLTDLSETELKQLLAAEAVEYVQAAKQEAAPQGIRPNPSPKPSVKASDKPSAVSIKETPAATPAASEGAPSADVDLDGAFGDDE